MCRKFSSRSCFCQMLIELFAQVLSPSIRAQDFDRFAVVLSGGPCLECFIAFKCFVLGPQEVGDGVPRRIVREGDEVSSPLTCGDGGRAPYVGVYFISKVLSRWTDPYFGYRQACGTREYARVAVPFLRVRVQFDSYDSATCDKFASALNCDMDK